MNCDNLRDWVTWLGCWILASAKFIQHILWCYDIDFEKAFTIDFQKDDFTCIVIVIEKDDLWKEIRERT